MLDAREQIVLEPIFVLLEIGPACGHFSAESEHTVDAALNGGELPVGPVYLDQFLHLRLEVAAG